jgi:hypothetical protein
LISLLHGEDRAEREAERNNRRAEREEFVAEEKTVSEWFDGVQVVADAAKLS